MRFEAMTIAELAGIDWIPQAILDRPVETFAGPGLTYHEDEDGLDAYRGVFGRLDGAAVAVKGYPGFPEGTVSLYLGPEVTDPDAIADLVRAALAGFGVPESALLWHRRDGDEPGEPLRARMAARRGT